MMRAGREISYWRDAYERVVLVDQQMGSFRESSFYARTVAQPCGESNGVGSRPPRPDSGRQARERPSIPQGRDQDAKFGGSAS